MNVKKTQGNSEEIICRLGRELLCKFGYTPMPINYERGDLNSIYNFKNYGIDDVIYANELKRDRLKFKKILPYNKDGIYYSIDYRSNNFSNYDKTNDNYIFSKLNEIVPETKLNEEFLLSRKGRKLKTIKGILSEYNPDYNFFIKFNEGYRKDLPFDALINAYLVPVTTLREQVVTNLNQIRKKHELELLNFKDIIDEDIVDLILDVHETFKLYQADDKSDYDFELINQRDNNQRLNPDLLMKIKEDYLLKYIKFDLNGKIEKRKS